MHVHITTLCIHCTNAFFVVPWGNTVRVGASYEEFAAGVQTKAKIIIDENPSNSIECNNGSSLVTATNSAESFSGHTSNDGTGSSDTSWQDDLLKTERSRVLVLSIGNLISSTTNITSFSIDDDNSKDKSSSSSSSSSNIGNNYRSSISTIIETNGQACSRLEDYG